MIRDHYTNDEHQAAAFAQSQAYRDDTDWAAGGRHLTPVTSLHVDCPRCDGRGEIEIKPYRNEWGVMDCERLDQCGICHGAGELPRSVAAEYEAWLKEQNDD